MILHLTRLSHFYAIFIFCLILLMHRPHFPASFFFLSFSLAFPLFSLLFVPLSSNVYCHRDIVRKKALMCVLRFYKKVPSIVAPLMDELRKALGDPNPSVMGAALTVYLEIITVCNYGLL